MKGMILAAGEGTRLRPLTYHTPKPMLPISGKPLLERVIVYLRNHGVTNLAINLYHLPEQVLDYFGNGEKWGVQLQYSIEEKLMGSAGGVKLLQSFFDETFMVYYGDVFMNADLSGMLTRHKQTKATATMGLYKVPDPWNRGIVELNDNNLITRFVEKPPREEAFSNLANAGVYILEPDVLDYIPTDTVYDFGNDVFPQLLTNKIPVAGYVLHGLLIDIGLPEKYEEANRVVAALQEKN